MLNSNKLGSDITNAFLETMEESGGEITKEVRSNTKNLSKKIAKAIDSYIRNADVKTTTDTPSITINPGIVTAGSPAAQVTTTPGILTPGTGIGTGKGRIL